MNLINYLIGKAGIKWTTKKHDIRHRLKSKDCYCFNASDFDFSGMDQSLFSKTLQYALSNGILNLGAQPDSDIVLGGNLKGKQVLDLQDFLNLESLLGADNTIIKNLLLHELAEGMVTQWGMPNGDTAIPDSEEIGNGAGTKKVPGSTYSTAQHPLGVNFENAGLRSDGSRIQRGGDLSKMQYDGPGGKFTIVPTMKFDSKTTWFRHLRFNQDGVLRDDRKTMVCHVFTDAYSASGLIFALPGRNWEGHRPR